VRGIGPIRRRLTFRRLIESFFNVWEEVFFSLDGTCLRVYRDSACLEAMFSVPLVNVKSLTIERKDQHLEGDAFMIVLKTFQTDHLQMQ
jgi:hypothetical protein